jgi:hypothetical protein
MLLVMIQIARSILVPTCIPGTESDDGVALNAESWLILKIEKKSSQTYPLILA